MRGSVLITAVARVSSATAVSLSLRSSLCLGEAGAFSEIFLTVDSVSVVVDDVTLHGEDVELKSEAVLDEASGTEDAAAVVGEGFFVGEGGLSSSLMVMVSGSLREGPGNLGEAAEAEVETDAEQAEAVAADLKWSRPC